MSAAFCECTWCKGCVRVMLKACEYCESESADRQGWRNFWARLNFNKSSNKSARYQLRNDECMCRGHDSCLYAPFQDPSIRPSNVPSRGQANIPQRQTEIQSMPTYMVGVYRPKDIAQPSSGGNERRDIRHGDGRLGVREETVYGSFVCMSRTEEQEWLFERSSSRAFMCARRPSAKVLS